MGGKGVVYRGVRLMPGSEAHSLYLACEWKKLDAHMKALDVKQFVLEGIITNTAWSIGRDSVTHN